MQNFFWILCLLVGDCIEQRAVRVFIQRRVHRGDPLRQPEHLLHLVHGFVEQVCHLFGRGFVVELLREMARSALIDVDLLQHMHRQANGAGLIHDAALDGLPDPPGGIGGKTKAAFGIELFYGAYEAEISFLDQVKQCQATVHVAPGDLHDETQIAFDHALARLIVAALRAPGVVHLFLGGQQGRETDLFQIDARRIRLLTVFRCRALASARFLRRIAAGIFLILIAVITRFLCRVVLLQGICDPFFSGRARRFSARHLPYLFGRYLRGSTGEPR